MFIRYSSDLINFAGCAIQMSNNNIISINVIFTCKNENLSYSICARRGDIKLTEPIVIDTRIIAGTLNYYL